MLNVSSAEDPHLEPAIAIFCDLGIELCAPVRPQEGAKPWQIEHILAKNRQFEQPSQEGKN
jgi:hypothetical protein